MSPRAAKGKGIQANQQADAAPQQNLDIALSALSTPDDPPAALQDPPAVHEDPHAIPEGASGIPRDLLATPMSPWAAQGKEIQANQEADAARRKCLDIATGALGAPWATPCAPADPPCAQWRIQRARGGRPRARRRPGQGNISNTAG